VHLWVLTGLADTLWVLTGLADTLYFVVDFVSERSVFLFAGQVLPPLRPSGACRHAVQPQCAGARAESCASKPRSWFRFTTFVGSCASKAASIKRQ